MLLNTRSCDACARTITGRVVELRMVVAVDEADGRHHEHDLRAEVCAPGCALTAARAVIERGYGVRVAA